MPVGMDVTHGGGHAGAVHVARAPRPDCPFQQLQPTLSKVSAELVNMAAVMRCATMRPVVLGHQVICISTFAQMASCSLI